MWLALLAQAIVVVCRTIALALGLAGDDRAAIDSALGAVLTGLTAQEMRDVGADATIEDFHSPILWDVLNRRAVA